MFQAFEECRSFRKHTACLHGRPPLSLKFKIKDLWVSWITKTQINGPFQISSLDGPVLEEIITVYRLYMIMNLLNVSLYCHSQLFLCPFFFFLSNSYKRVKMKTNIYTCCWKMRLSLGDKFGSEEFLEKTLLARSVAEQMSRRASSLVRSL